MWNKQRKDEVLIDVEDVALGHETRMRWNPQAAWIFSADPVHEALVSQQTFKDTQALLAASPSRSAHRGPRAEARTYVLRGMIFCGACARRMAGAWNNDCVHYRCKLKAADARLAAAGHPNSIYVREDRILDRLDDWLDGLFATGRRDATVDALYDAGTDPATQARRAAVTARLHACDQKLAAYRAALEAGADPAVVTGWIAEITAERTRHQIELDQVTGRPRLTRTQIAALVDQMAGIAALLRRADPRDRAAVYDQLGLKLTYESEERLVVAETGLTGHGDFQRVRGAILTTTT